MSTRDPHLQHRIIAQALRLRRTITQPTGTWAQREPRLATVRNHNAFAAASTALHAQPDYTADRQPLADWEAEP